MNGTVLAAGLFLILLSCSQEESPLNPKAPEEEVEQTWQELLASDPSYPDNVYLTEFIAWEPGLVGVSRRGGEYTDSEGHPLVQFAQNALGPPEGSGSGTSGEGQTCPLGVNGWGIWKFDPRFVITNGAGDDFRTFTKTFAWGSTADGLCSELAHVEVSADGEIWYSHDSEVYVENPEQDSNNDSYRYASVMNLHGNEPSWANFRTDIQAESLETLDGVVQWVSLPGVTVSRYFTPGDDYLGGVGFDLSDFHLKGNPSILWPAGGRMQYLKIIDDSTILDGQDYDKAWCLGANLMSAMGINVLPSGVDD